jgi:pimeloyl-ACP methyl ester carboxylesterase
LAGHAYGKYLVGLWIIDHMLTRFGGMSRLAIKCFAIIVLVSGASTATFAATNPNVHLKVYLLRGLTNVLSPGIDQLADELRKRNIDATIANHAFSESLATEAIQECRSGRVGSIVLVGHSLGASAAVSMAEQLRQAGLHVALIVTLDPVVKTFVPNNVHLLKNFYLSSGVGTAVERGGKFRGLLQNVDMGRNAELGHVSLTTAPSIQKQIIRDILAASSGCR